MRFKKHVFGWLWGAALMAFSLYVVLDTFVIARTYEVVAYTDAVKNSNDASVTASTSIEIEPQILYVTTDSLHAVEEDAASADENAEDVVSENPIIGDSGYHDENIDIQLTEYRIADTTVYAAEVTLSSADYLKTAFANNAYGRNVTAKTSQTANTVNAILAVNGDYYGAQQSGYVIRNGVLYRGSARKNAQDLVIFADGSFDIVYESDITAEELLQKGAWNVLSFGPSLLEDGELTVSVNDEVGRAKASNPRTAIGIIDELHYVFVVSDGRTSESEGLSLYELATFMKTLGIQTAYNLDGGGSSTMVLNGILINNPTTSGNSTKERSVSDIVYIGY